jgi:hypothetical protein
MKWRAWYVVVPGVLALAAIAVGSVLWYFHHASAFLETDPGSPGGCAIVDTERGPLAVVFDFVEHGRTGRASTSALVSGHRIVALEARTGAQVATIVRDNGYSTCWGAAKGRMWCEVGEEMHVIAVPGFTDVAGMNAIVAKAGLAHPLKHSWRADGSAIVTKLADGRNARVDAATLTAAAAPDEYLSGTQTPNAVTCKLASHLDLDSHSHLTFGDASRAPLLLKTNNADDVTLGSTFLKPKFLMTGDPAAVLVFHATALDGTTFVLTRLDANHREQWSAPIPGDCETANLVDSLLVISMTNPERRALAVDLANGKIVWELSFSE